MTRNQIPAYSTLAQEFTLLADEPLKKHTAFKVGGPADLLALPKDRQELIRLLKRASSLKIPMTLFGGGTNLLVTDKGIRGLVVITRQLKSTPRIMGTDSEDTLIYAEAGERLSTVCRFAVTHSLSGLEFAAGIPGTLGGAIAMNAGTPGGDMGGIVDAIEVLDKKTLEIKTLGRNQLDFSYRHFTLPGIIVAATLVLKKADQEKIKACFDENIKKKNATQPVSLASAGCFFKNPNQGMSAGELIEKSGLKGMRVNDAMVSEIHANYIVNINAATSRDILLLKQQIQDIVFEKYHINLEAEVRVEGE